MSMGIQNPTLYQLGNTQFMIQVKTFVTTAFFAFCIYMLVAWFPLKCYTMAVCDETMNLMYVRHTIELQRDFLFFSLCTVSDHVLFTYVLYNTKDKEKQDVCTHTYAD